MFGIFILEIVMITAAAMNFNQKTASAGILQVLPIMAALIGIDIWSRSHYFKLTAFLRDIQSFSDSVGNPFLCSILFKSLLEAFMDLVMFQTYFTLEAQKWLFYFPNEILECSSVLRSTSRISSHLH